MYKYATETEFNVKVKNKYKCILDPFHFHSSQNYGHAQGLKRLKWFQKQHLHHKYEITY